MKRGESNGSKRREAGNTQWVSQPISGSSLNNIMVCS